MKCVSKFLAIPDQIESKYHGYSVVYLFYFTGCKISGKSKW